MRRNWPNSSAPAFLSNLANRIFRDRHGGNAVVAAMRVWPYQSRSCNCRATWRRSLKASPLTARSVRHRRRHFVLVAAILASALGFIDGSILAIAMPAIRVDLGASLAEAQWISNAYALTLSALILAGGAAGDRSGCAAPSSPASRCSLLRRLPARWRRTRRADCCFGRLQGIGAAIMVPGSLAIIAKAYPKKSAAGRSASGPPPRR